MAQSPVSNPSSNNQEDENYRGLTAYDSLNKGDATSNESSLGEEGLTTSRVNRAAMDEGGSDADESFEHRASRSDAGNTSELMSDRDADDDAGNGAGADAGRPPLRNGDTGYAG
jgi:hypothetical protein